MKKRMNKKVLDACYTFVEQWAEGGALSTVYFMEVLKEHDPDAFFQAFKIGYEKALKARVAAGKP